MNELPKDPMLLLSVVNMQLRDRFPTLERFAAANLTTPEEIKEKLSSIDYEYDEKLNQFV